MEWAYHLSECEITRPSTLILYFMAYLIHYFIVSYIALQLVNDAFVQQIVFLENFLKWVHLSIELSKYQKSVTDLNNNRLIPKSLIPNYI